MNNLDLAIPFLNCSHQLSRKRRRHWIRQIIKANPGVNVAYLFAPYFVELAWHPDAVQPSRWQVISKT